jgi:SAM-dependent methyltransferase
MVIPHAYRRELALRAVDHHRETPPGATSGIHFAEALVEAVVEDFTRPGDRVLDPFAGWGTAVLVADRMGRHGLGVELQPHRVDHATASLGAGSASQVVCGDARDLGAMDIGEFDLCLTSPPFMTGGQHPEDPLDAYRTHGGDYLSYLAGLRRIFCEVGRHMRDGGHIVVNVATLQTDEGITPLAADLKRELGSLFAFRGEICLDWDVRSAFIVADYCLVFQVNGTGGP